LSLKRTRMWSPFLKVAIIPRNDGGKVKKGGGFCVDRVPRSETEQMPL